MSWAGSDRRARLPDNWDELVAETRERAGGQCEAKVFASRGGRFRCPHPGTDCDHIERGDDHRQENLQWLCEYHHRKKTSAEGLAARDAIKAKGTRPPEQHPGRIRRNP